MGKIKLIVFDWDGVIVDSMPLFAIGIQKVAASFGVHKTVEEIVANYFQPRQAYYSSIGIVPTNIEELHRRHGEAVAEHIGKALIFSDVLPTLESLKVQGYVLAIATQNESRDAIEETKRVDVKSFFPDDLIVGGQGPKTEKLLKIISILHCKPNEVLYVGDLPSDILSARNVGVLSAGIARNEGQIDRLLKEKPDYLLRSLSELSVIK